MNLQTSPDWAASYLLECLHRAGFNVRAENGKVVVDHPDREVDEFLRADIERHHDALLKMLQVAEDLALTMKGPPNG